MIRTITLIASIATLLTSCITDDTSTDNIDSKDLIGEWYGSGRNIKENEINELCLIFCKNGKMFGGDSRCSETTRGDFDHYQNYSTSENQLVTTPNNMKDNETVLINITDDSMNLEMISGSELIAVYSFKKVGESSDICSDSDRTLREFEEDD
ncbi:MAG: hypothetical protein OCD01_14255 [Fibrobacterales bacterium]